MPTVWCPSCGAMMHVSAELLGRKARCKGCDEVFTLGASDGVTAAPGAAAPPAAPPPAPPPASSRTSTQGAIRVVARRVEAPGAPAPAAGRGRLALWLGVAGAGLLLPVLCAGAGLAVWHFASRGDSPATLYAGVEIGSTGVKGIVLRAIPDPEVGYKVYPQDEPQTINTSLVTGLEDRKRFDDDALRETARAVARLCKEAQTKYKVPEGHVYVIGGSSLFSGLRKKNDPGAEEVIRKSKDELARAVQETAGRTIRFIEAADEAELLFKGTVPTPYADRAVLYDVGSGSTRGACASSPGTIMPLELHAGTKTYAAQVQKEAKKTGRPFAEEARRLADEALRQPLHEQFERKPPFLNRDRVYLNGGLVWVLATYVHPEDRGAMVPLDLRDVDAFAQMIDLDRQAVIDRCVQRADAKDKKEVEKDVRRAVETFTPDQLRAGVEVFRALAAEGKFEGKKLYFARTGLFAWLLVYVKEKESVR